MEKNDKLEFNKKMIGKTVLVLEQGSNWTGIVNEVVDSDTFRITNIKGSNKKVDIFDVRSI
jgi:hypothetical protein